MKVSRFPSLSLIAPIIRSVAASQASRFFKTERNTPERSALVSFIIRSEINLALSDVGGGISQIVNDIDPTDEIVEAMKKVGSDNACGTPSRRLSRIL